MLFISNAMLQQLKFFPIRAPLITLLEKAPAKKIEPFLGFSIFISLQVSSSQQVLIILKFVTYPISYTFSLSLSPGYWGVSNCMFTILASYIYQCSQLAKQQVIVQIYHQTQSGVNASLAVLDLCCHYVRSSVVLWGVKGQSRALHPSVQSQQRIQLQLADSFGSFRLKEIEMKGRGDRVSQTILCLRVVFVWVTQYIDIGGRF